MNTARFRFYAELNDFLPNERRARESVHAFHGTPAIKDAIEAQGVPHTEVDLILVNDVSVGFDHRLQGGERVAVYPVFESFDISPIVRLRERPLRTTRFILDDHLGKLARLLRLLGFDARYAHHGSDREIIHAARAEGRIILTRDRGLLRVREVTHAYCVRSADPHEQAREIVTRFDLGSQVQPFRRCMACNGLIHAATRDEVLDRLPPLTRLHYQEFHRCADCGRVYWKGSHYEAMRASLREWFGLR